MAGASETLAFVALGNDPAGINRSMGMRGLIASTNAENDVGPLEAGMGFGLAIGGDRRCRYDDIATFSLETCVNVAVDQCVQLIRGSSFRQYVPNARCVVHARSDDAAAIGAKLRA